MIEYHGWMTLRESPSEIDGGKLYKTVEYLKAEIAKSSYSNVEINLKYINGSCQFWLSGNANHLPKEYEEIIDLLRRISSEATGSYGLIYVWDDENKNSSNEFQVFVIKRGSIKREKDPFLSPCVPIIEDEE